MFSPAERRYLALVSGSRSEGTDPDARLEAAFPNPVYRRKLLWGIRKKTVQAAADWELLSGAARAEERVLPRGTGTVPREVPLVEDPIVTLLHRVQGAFSRQAPSVGKRGRPARSAVEKERRP